MTSLSANGGAGRVEDENGVFNLCIAELSFSHAGKRKNGTPMNDGMNKKSERYVRHGSALNSVGCIHGD